MLVNTRRNIDTFALLKDEITQRFSSDEITVDEFVSLMDTIKETEKDGTLSVQEVRIMIESLYTTFMLFYINNTSIN